MLIEEAIRVDRLLLIDAPPDDRRKRIRLRNPDWSESDIDNVITLQAQQLTIREHQTKQTVEIDLITNDTNLEQVALKIKALHKHYTKFFKG